MSRIAYFIPFILSMCLTSQCMEYDDIPGKLFEAVEQQNVTRIESYLEYIKANYGEIKNERGETLLQAAIRIGSDTISEWFLEHINGTSLQLFDSNATAQGAFSMAIEYVRDRTVKKILDQQSATYYFAYYAYEATVNPRSLQRALTTFTKLRNQTDIQKIVTIIELLLGLGSFDLNDITTVLTLAIKHPEQKSAFGRLLSLILNNATSGWLLPLARYIDLIVGASDDRDDLLNVILLRSKGRVVKREIRGALLEAQRNGNNKCYVSLCAMLRQNGAQIDMLQQSVRDNHGDTRQELEELDQTCRRLREREKELHNQLFMAIERCRFDPDSQRKLMLILLNQQTYFPFHATIFNPHIDHVLELDRSMILFHLNLRIVACLGEEHGDAIARALMEGNCASIRVILPQWSTAKLREARDAVIRSASTIVNEEVLVKVRAVLTCLEQEIQIEPHLG